MNEFTGSITGIRYVTKPVGPTNTSDPPVYDRGELVPGYRHTALRQCIAVLVGTGGIGGEIGIVLMRKGIWRLKALDDDVVELSNLNRQRFFREDLYKNKALALAKNLVREATQRTEIIGYPFRFQDAVEQDVDLTCTLAVCGVDNDQTRVEVSRYYRALAIPVVFIGVSRDASCGYVFVQEAHPESPCFGCLNPGAVGNTTRNICTPAGATIDILKAVAGIATYAIDSLIMPRRRDWNYKEVFLTGELQDGHRKEPKRKDCPLCGT